MTVRSSLVLLVQFGSPEASFISVTYRIHAAYTYIYADAAFLLPYIQVYHALASICLLHAYISIFQNI
jgi:hypothetical protein